MPRGPARCGRMPPATPRPRRRTTTTRHRLLGTAGALVALALLAPLTAPSRSATDPKDISYVLEGAVQENYWAGRMSRRGIVSSAGALGVGLAAAVAACGGDSGNKSGTSSGAPPGNTGTAVAASTAAPKRGGTLNFRTYGDLPTWVPVGTQAVPPVSSSIFNGLIIYAATNHDLRPDSIKGELA